MKRAYFKTESVARAFAKAAPGRHLWPRYIVRHGVVGYAVHVPDKK